MRPLSTQLPTFALAMLIEVGDLPDFEPIWDGANDLDEVMMDFGTLLDAPEGP